MFWALLVFGLVQLGTSKSLLKRWDNLAVKHSWPEIPRGWEYKAPAPSNYVFNLRIGLKQNKINDLIDNLMEISDPTNPRYHCSLLFSSLSTNKPRYSQHLTKEEAQSFVAPHPDSVEAINSWLEFHHIDPLSSVHRSGSGDWVTLPIPVDLAEKMLGTKYNIYRHVTSGEEVIRTLSYSLPEELLEHIDVIVPSTYFGTLRSMKVTSFLQPTHNIVQDTSSVPEGTLASSCNNTITPACLRALYHTSSYVPSSTNVNKIAVAGYLDEFANYADLQVGNLLQGFVSWSKSTSK